MARRVHATDKPTVPTDAASHPDDAPDATVRAAALSDVWIDRDLSWLEFNRRVLAEALDERTPLLEQVKFLAIFSANLDEFFMKRIALLREPSSSSRVRRLEQLRNRLQAMLDEQALHFDTRIVPALSRHGVHLRSWHELSEREQREAHDYFDTQISAALTPLVIRPSQPFPFFSNLSVSLAFRLHDDRTHDVVHTRVKVPSELPQWVRLTSATPGEHTFVRLHDVIQENAHKLYPGMRLSAPVLFRLTRDSEVDIEEDADQDVRELVQEQIRQRRFEPAVRLEFARHADPQLKQLLLDRFGLADVDVYEQAGELDYSSLFQIAALDLPHLRDAPWTPVTPSRLADHDDIFQAIRAGDLLVHHPYDSFDDTVERFIEAAADDARTLAVKMTVYRVGDDTPFVRSLIRAAEAGKQVACVIELKARFDEARNLHWALELERAGAHVTVGEVALKTHAKVALVVRREPDGLRSYAHVGTGNYHVRTARLYTDVGLLTCDPAITRDVVALFHHLTGRSDPPALPTLLTAPTTMRPRFLELIARETAHQQAGKPARIVAKMNQLEDPAIIAALSAASRAGVRIDLIVRGLCCLAPRVEGASEHIRIRSIVGRFLEHSRIFHFAAGHDDPLEGDFFIGSADWMFRNLSSRVEVVTPVFAPDAKQHLWEILDTCLSDRRQAWEMESDGSYTRLQPNPGGEGSPHVGTHRALMDAATRRLL
jgi:polyphosphate kinase